MAKKLSPKRVAQLSKNPATRTKVPTSQLSPQHRKMRLANAKSKSKSPVKANPLDDPNALTQPLTPRLLNEQVSTATNLYAAPAEKEIAGERAVSGQMQANIPAWFQQYQDALHRATGATGGAYAAAIAAQQNAVNTTGQLAAQNDAAQQQAMAADAAQRGAAVDPALAREAAQALLARRSSGDAQTALTAGLGAAQVAYRGGQEGVAAGQRLSTQLGEARRGRSIDKAAGELATRKGEYATTTRQKLIDSEHTKQLERKAFGLNVIKAEDDARADAASVAARRAATKATERAANARLIVSQRNTDVNVRARQELQDQRLTETARQKDADRAAARERAKITARGTGATPTERRRRADAVNKANQIRDRAVATAQQYRDGLSKSKARTPQKLASDIRLGLQEDFPDAPKEVLDYALAAALGSKAGVTKKGQPSAAARYYAYLRDLSSGRRSK